MADISMRAMIIQAQQAIYDQMRAEFEGMGTGGRYCRQQKEYALKLIDDYGVRAVARILGMPRRTCQRWCREQGKHVKRSPDWVYSWAAIRNIIAFLNWAVKDRLVASGLEVETVKVPQKPVTALAPQQVRGLLLASSRYPTPRLRVLLAVTTGLRRGDIEAIRIGDIHFDRNTVATQNRKAGKAMAERPIPEAIMMELSNHVTTLPDG